MTAFHYASTAATALRLLERFGAPCTLRRHSGGTYDPATGTSTPTETDLPTTAAVFDYPAGYVDGTLIQAGDRRAYMPATPAPAQGDQFVWAGRTLTVIDVKAVAPAGTAVLFEANVRG